LRRFCSQNIEPVGLKSSDIENKRLKGGKWPLERVFRHQVFRSLFFVLRKSKEQKPEDRPEQAPGESEGRPVVAQEFHSWEVEGAHLPAVLSSRFSVLSEKRKPGADDIDGARIEKERKSNAPPSRQLRARRVGHDYK
jgi:hypothetical protein